MAGDAVEVVLTRRIPVPPEEVVERLSEDPARLLGPADRESGPPGQRHLIPLSVHFAGVRFDRAAAVGIGALVEEDDGSRLLPLWWEAAEHPRLFPTFAGGLEVRPNDDGAELRLEGHYWPPLGTAGGLVNRAVLNRAATTSLETLLDHLAARLTS